MQIHYDVATDLLYLRFDDRRQEVVNSQSRKTSFWTWVTATK